MRYATILSNHRLKRTPSRDNPLIVWRQSYFRAVKKGGHDRAGAIFQLSHPSIIASFIVATAYAAHLEVMNIATLFDCFCFFGVNSSRLNSLHHVESTPQTH